MNQLLEIFTFITGKKSAYLLLFSGVVLEGFLLMYKCIVYK